MSTPSAAPGPRYRRMERDERREQILAVARRLFTELPYSEVSTAAIAREAGVQRGLLHYYFGTKRDLFLTVVRNLVSQIAYDVPDIDPGLPLNELVDICVTVFLDFSAANSAVWFAAIDAEGFGQDPDVVRIMSRARDATVESMLAVLPVPAPSETVRAVLRAYSGMAEAATREWLQSETLSRGQVHSLLAGVLRGLLTGLVPVLEPAAGGVAGEAGDGEPDDFAGDAGADA